MIRKSLRRIPRLLGVLCCLTAWIPAAFARTTPQDPPAAASSPAASPTSGQDPQANSSASAPQQPSSTITKQTRQAGEQVRIPRQAALSTSALDGIVRDAGFTNLTVPVPGAHLTLRDLQNGKTVSAMATAEGVFRIFPIMPGHYELRVEAQDYGVFVRSDVTLNANEVLSLEISLVTVAAAEARSRLPRQPELGPALSAEPPASLGSYREFRHRLDADPGYIENLTPDVLPRVADVYNSVPDRWALEQPDYRRYPQKGEYTYTKPHWYDPFNRNKFKGDEPIWPELFGPQVFLNVTATSETFFDGRRVPSPSNVSAARPGSADFFGKGEQAFVDQTVRISFDLFHGDASFKPIDWRIRITPELSLTDLDVRELGIVRPSVLGGTNRFDGHVGLQEAFGEVKIHDLGPNYDFVSVRAGIQEFNADFRGFVFLDEEPGVRIFGDLHSDRIEYNVAYFNFLEKDTNSGLNSFHRRDQQVTLGNVYLQDFFFPGYTAEFIGIWNKDDGGLHYDDNGFLVRPEPVGQVINQGNGPILHSLSIGYAGWLGSGHIGRLNITHAFYEAFGKDTFNPLAGRKVTVNAQMAAAELSYDHDWIRYRVSAFYTSGDSKPQSDRANGFDSIDDLPNFAGGLFSFWNREAIRLTGSAIQLTSDGSLIPSLRSSKEEGQSNFVNPGIFIANAGIDFDVTPKLKGFVNFNYLTFMDTQSLQNILFQGQIHHSIGEDVGLGVEYRPPLSENIVLIGGASMLQPGQGFTNIYSDRTLFSLFGIVKFTF